MSNLLTFFFFSQLFASNVEGKSSPSEVLVCTTSPDRPGPPTRPIIKGPITSHGFSVKWGKPVWFVIGDSGAVIMVNVQFECSSVNTFWNVDFTLLLNTQSSMHLEI